MGQKQAQHESQRGDHQVKTALGPRGAGFYFGIEQFARADVAHDFLVHQQGLLLHLHRATHFVHQEVRHLFLGGGSLLQLLHFVFQKEHVGFKAFISLLPGCGVCKDHEGGVRGVHARGQ